MRYICCVALFVAVRVCGFSQEINEIEVPYSSSIKKEITFKPHYGEGDPVVIEVEFKRNIPSDTFSMTFKSSLRHDGKFLYLFGGGYRLSAVAKAYPNVWFDKKLSKKGKTVVRYYDDGIQKENISPKEAVQYFRMDSADFTINFSQSTWTGDIYAYVAVTNKKGKADRQIIYLAKVPINITSINPCGDNIVKSKIEKLNNLSAEKSQITTEINNLRKISCEDYKSSSLNFKDTTLFSDCIACSYCSDFVALRDKSSEAIKEYVDAVNDYNTLLADIAKKYEKPCVSSGPCACNCTKFKEIREKVGSLLWDVQTERIDKVKAIDEFRKIQSSLPCSGKCKDCETACKTCNTYKAYKKDCDELKKLLKIK